MGYVKTIALDGPAGSGKSTLGKQLAQEIGYLLSGYRDALSGDYAPCADG